jgi:transcriptional regulator
MGRGSDKLRGSLDLLILKTLRRGPLHGYGITLAVETGSQGELLVEDGSLYPALHRLEAEGLVTAEWRPGASSRPAKFYTLTPSGRKALEQRTADWRAFASTLSTFLDQQ